MSTDTTTTVPSRPRWTLSPLPAPSWTGPQASRSSTHADRDDGRQAGVVDANVVVAPARPSPSQEARGSSGGVDRHHDNSVLSTGRISVAATRPDSALDRPARMQASGGGKVVVIVGRGVVAAPRSAHGRAAGFQRGRQGAQARRRGRTNRRGGGRRRAPWLTGGPSTPEVVGWGDGNDSPAVCSTNADTSTGT